MKHKRQHYVPRCYLEAWCDGASPPGQEPYVWVFPKDGGTGRRRAPKNLFYESDLYTIRGTNDHRDLKLEHGLSQLEGEFSRLRERKLSKREQLSYRDHVILCAFVAAMSARTKAKRDHWRTQWRRLIEMGERMEEVAKHASPDALRRMASIAGPYPEQGKSFSIDEVREWAEQPMPGLLDSHILGGTPLLMRMRIGVAETSPTPGFITSDDPCVWFDPQSVLLPPLMRSAGLGSPTVEITLPISPSQVLFLGYQLQVERYLRLDPEDPIVTEINRRTRARAYEELVVNSNVTDPSWFQ